MWRVGWRLVSAFLARRGLCGYWCVVGEGVSLPPFFVCVPVDRSRVWGVSCFCLGVWLIVAGFHIGARGKAAGRVVRCSAKKGACKLMGADGAPTPHFASLAEGEAFLAEQEAAQRGGFTGPADSECESAAPGGGVGGGLLSVEAEMVHSCACCDPVDGPTSAASVRVMMSVIVRTAGVLRGIILSGRMIIGIE